MKIKNEEIEVRSEIVIVDRNPEMSEIGNSEGYIHGIRYLVVVTFSDGTRIRHNHWFTSKGKAEALRDKIDEVRVIDINHWAYHYPVYGSPAYEAEESFLTFVEKNS